jgi:hypothetical protein
MSEKVEKSRKSSFPMFWGSGGSKSRLAKATGAEPKADERVDKLQNALVRGRKPQPQRAQRKTRQARPHQTETAAMVGPAQLLACRLRVLYKGNEAKVRRALKERFSPSRASQLLADTRQSLPRSWQQQQRQTAQDPRHWISRGKIRSQSTTAWISPEQKLRRTSIFNNWFTNFRFESVKSILWSGIYPG